MIGLLKTISNKDCRNLIVVFLFLLSIFALLTPVKILAAEEPDQITDMEAMIFQEAVRRGLSYAEAADEVRFVSDVLDPNSDDVLQMGETEETNNGVWSWREDRVYVPHFEPRNKISLEEARKKLEDMGFSDPTDAEVRVFREAVRNGLSSEAAKEEVAAVGDLFDPHSDDVLQVGETEETDRGWWSWENGAPHFEPRNKISLEEAKDRLSQAGYGGGFGSAGDNSAGDNSAGDDPELGAMQLEWQYKNPLGKDPEDSNPGEDITSFTDLIVGFLTKVQAIIGWLAVIMLVVGGMLYITAFGRQNQLEWAKNTITYALIGIALVLAAPSFLREIMSLFGDEQATGEDVVSQAKDIKTILLSVLQWIIAIFGIVALVSFVISGMRFIFAGGDTQKTEKARRGIFYSLLGVLVAGSALLIIKEILRIIGIGQ